MRKAVAILILAAALASATLIEITIQDTMKIVATHLNISKSGFYTVTMSVENPGSVPCNVQEELVSGKQRIWSRKVMMNPGDIAELEAPYFTSEEENVSILLHYCDRIKTVGSFIAEPTGMKLSNISARVFAINGKIYAPKGIAAMPYGNPQNWIIESSPTGGKLNVIEGPEPGDEITLILSNGTAYSIQKVKMLEFPAWAIALAAGFGGGMIAGLCIGKIHSGRKNSQKRKRKVARKAKARHGRARNS